MTSTAIAISLSLILTAAVIVAMAARLVALRVRGLQSEIKGLHERLDPSLAGLDQDAQVMRAELASIRRSLED